jgi:hypothetical protein
VVPRCLVILLKKATEPSRADLASGVESRVSSHDTGIADPLLWRIKAMHATSPSRQSK